MNKSNIKLILLCWAVYASAYLGRYSYNSNISLVMENFGVNHAQAGTVTTFFFFFYGAGQIINGILCKFYPKRYVISGVLVLSSALNLAVFLGVPFFMYKYLWILNGLAQSVLWSSLIYLLSKKLDSKYINKSIIVMSTTVAAGTFVIYGASSLVNLLGDFRLTFLLAAVVMTAVAAVWFFSYNRIQTGLAAENKNSEKTETAPEQSCPAERTGKKKMSSSVFGIIFFLCIYAVADNLVKEGLATWVPTILKEEYALSDSLSIFMSLLLPLLGMFGAFLVVFLNKRIKNYSNLSGILFFASFLCIAAVLLLLNSTLWVLVLAVFGVVSLFTHGINNVITSIAPLQMRKEINSGMLVGILNGFCYVGSTISTYFLGYIADVSGWKGVFVFLLFVCAAACAVSLVRMIADVANRAKAQKIASAEKTGGA